MERKPKKMVLLKIKKLHGEMEREGLQNLIVHLCNNTKKRQPYREQQTDRQTDRKTDRQIDRLIY